MDLDAYLTERSALVDAVLEAALPRAGDAPAELCAAMRHLVFPAGKRLRPAFALAGCEAAGAPPQRALAVAAAVELVHVYSMIHDDLPCMDDDDERRGRPTVHVAFGEALAVLAGDALLARAFEVLAGARPGIAAEVVLATLRDLAAAAGAGSLVGGQVDDLRDEDGATSDARRVEDVHRRKTAGLIAFAVAGGARFAGADEDRLGRLRRFGEAVGVAFQIADDLLDEGADGGCSLVRALGAPAARARAEALLSEALVELEALGERAEPLRELARFAVRRER